MDQPALFDLDQLARAAIAAQPWHGAPLGFTTDYHAPDALDAAWKRWSAEHGNVGASPRSHMWTAAMWNRPTFTADHSLITYSADLRCESHRGDCLDVGDLLYLAICEDCAWHTIAATENTVIEAWHDHAIPGWRDLPPLPKKVDPSGPKALAFISEHYPEAFQRDGYPVRTHRSPNGTRHVSGRSPLGGYDLAIHDPEEDDDRP